MNFTISKEALQPSLILLAGIAERRQTLPMLSHVLVRLHENQLTLIATDHEVQLVSTICLDQPGTSGEMTLPARKLLDICRSLPEHTNISIVQEEGQRAVLKAAKARFTLANLPPEGFPMMEDAPGSVEFSAEQKVLPYLIERTASAVAQNDARLYLNGLLLEVGDGYIRTVATDGHRLALSTHNASVNGPITRVIIPRKSIIELAKLLGDNDEPASFSLAANSIRVVMNQYSYTSNLIDSNFPDYNLFLPAKSDISVEIDPAALKALLQRSSILSPEHKVKFMLRPGKLLLLATNAEREESTDEIDIAYDGADIDIQLNSKYLLDGLSTVRVEPVRLTIAAGNKGVFIEDGAEDSLYMVMAIRL
ncbi:DNA polymerase III subunit beta [soil metagenome]